MNLPYTTINGLKYSNVIDSSKYLNLSKSRIYQLINSGFLTNLNLGHGKNFIEYEDLLKYKIDNSKIELNEDDILYDYTHEKLSISKICEKYKTHNKKIKDILINLGITIKPASDFIITNNLKDETIFDTINNEFSAYFLGLLWADGCNLQSKNMIQISLSDPDSDILIKISESLFGINKVKKFVRGGNRKDRNTLSIYSKKISKLMDTYGFNNKRNSIGGEPKIEIDKKFFHHFLRGLWDGDGSIYYINYSQDFATQFIGSPLLCEFLKNKLKEYYNFDINIVDEDSYSFKMKRLNIYGNKKLLRFLNIMYNDSKLFLNRKHQKYLDLIDSNSIF